MRRAGRGMLLVSIGTFFEKGLRMGVGQCNVKRYNRQLRDLIIAGRAKPSFVVSHELPFGGGARRLREVRQTNRRLHQGGTASVSGRGVNDQIPARRTHQQKRRFHNGHNGQTHTKRGVGIDCALRVIESARLRAAAIGVP